MNWKWLKMLFSIDLGHSWGLWNPQWLQGSHLFKACSNHSGTLQKLSVHFLQLLISSQDLIPTPFTPWLCTQYSQWSCSWSKTLCNLNIEKTEIMRDHSKENSTLKAVTNVFLGICRKPFSDGKTLKSFRKYGRHGQRNKEKLNCPPSEEHLSNT